MYINFYLRILCVLDNLKINVGLNMYKIIIESIEDEIVLFCRLNRQILACEKVMSVLEKKLQVSTKHHH